MATGAFSTTPRRGPGQDAVSTAKARSISPQDEARIQSLLLAAGRAHEAGNQDKLQAALEEVLEIDPDHAKATYNLGILHRDRDDIFKAETYLRRAIKLDPYMIDAFQGLADILFGAKHLLPASKIYEEALERAPNRLPLLQNLARARMMLKEAGEAERLARRILSIDERAPDAWATLAWALLHRNGDPHETLEAAEQAARLGSDASYGQPIKEQALRRVGRVEEADALWDKLLSQAAQDWDKARAYNEVYYWLNALDRCRAIAGAFVEANPTKAEGLKDLASLMMAEGEFEMAQEVLDRATAIAPDIKVVVMASGLNAFRIGQYKRGLELYAARWNRNTHDKPWDIPVSRLGRQAARRPPDRVLRAGHRRLCHVLAAVLGTAQIREGRHHRGQRAHCQPVPAQFPRHADRRPQCAADELGSQPLPRQDRHGRPAVAAAGARSRTCRTGVAISSPSRPWR